MYKNILENIAKNEISDYKSEENLLSKQEVIDFMVDMLLKKHEENKDIPMEVLVKNWKKAFANGVTMLGLIHGAHYMNAPEGPKSESKKIQEQSQIEQARINARNEGLGLYEKNKQKARDKSISSFLENISMIESSGGKNTNHKKMESGIHAGDAAIGKYGFMPNTVKDIANRLDESSPLRSYAKMDNKQIAQTLADNPEHQDKLAGHLANRLHDKFGGDETKMAYSWFSGHNLKPKDFENSKHSNYQEHDYVNKYNKYKTTLEKKPNDNLQNNKQNK